MMFPKNFHPVGVSKRGMLSCLATRSTIKPIISINQLSLLKPAEEVGMDLQTPINPINHVYKIQLRQKFKNQNL